MAKILFDLKRFFEFFNGNR